MKPLISSVKIEVQGNHARLGVYNRGAKAGVLIVNKDDAFLVAIRLVDGRAPIYINDWKWVPEKNYVWFGNRIGNNDYWELRIYPDLFGVKWEAWNYQESDPLMINHGTEDSFNEAFLVAMDYVNQVEVG